MIAGPSLLPTWLAIGCVIASSAFAICIALWLRTVAGEQADLAGRLADELIVLDERERRCRVRENELASTAALNKIARDHGANRL